MSFMGTALLILAFLVAIYSMAAALLDSRKNKYGFPINARYGVFAVAGLVTLAMVLLLIAFLTHDFSLQYVADYSSRDTSLAYLITGLWAGNAGSVFFWGWVVAVAGAVLLWRSNKDDKDLMPNALAVILFTEVLFLILVFIESPFKASATIPADGIGLKLILQNVGMIFHPPLLLAGYALLTVPAALAISAVAGRKMDDTWIITAKRWAIAAWLLLGLGNILGMWWAYAVLGWGGYWAWDPVENAGLMPWLLVTAFLHAGMMYTRRGLFKTRTAMLAMCAFWLTIFGAFLTRSDVKGSVHTFGGTPMTPAFIIFLAITLIGCVWLIIDRRKSIKSAEGDEALISGTGTFSLVTLLLVISTVFILVGTTLPVFTDIIPPKTYFNVANLPVFLAIILLAGACVLVGWKTSDIKKFNKQMLWSAGAGLVVVIALIIAGLSQFHALVPIFILVAVLVATLIKWATDVSARMRGKTENALAAFGGLFIANRSRYGGYIIHIAIVLMTLGIIGSSVYKTEAEVQLPVGGTAEIAGFTLTFNGLMPEASDKVMVFTADLTVSRDGKEIGELHPELIYQAGDEHGFPKVGIRSTLSEDLYVSLDGGDSDGSAYFTVTVNPLTSWIWIGGFLLLIGGLVSFSARARKPTEE